MINSTSKTDHLQRPELLAGRLAQPRVAPTRSTETDSVRASGQETLQAALSAQPEVRSEVVERAKQLLVDGNYPPKDIIRRLSQMIVNSEDLSE